MHHLCVEIPESQESVSSGMWATQPCMSHLSQNIVSKCQSHLFQDTLPETCPLHISCCMSALGLHAKLAQEPNEASKKTRNQIISASTILRSHLEAY